MTKSNASFEILYQNARGLRTKSSEFFANVLSSTCPIIVITETWLSNDISSAQYFPPNYEVYRADRNLAGPKKKGGGVLVAVERSLQCVRRQELETQGECVWLDVRLLEGKKLLIGAFYVPPDTTPSVFNSVLSSIEQASTLNSNHKLLVLGDFNTPGVNWDSHTFSHYNYNNEQKCSMILDFSAFTSLPQLNRTKNGSGSILDLCFTDISNVQVFHSDIAVVRPDKFHPPLLISTYLSVQRDIAPSSYSTPRRYCFRRGDYVGLYQYLSSADWSTVLIHSDVDAQVDCFTDIIKNGMDRFIPKSKNSQKFPFWFSNELRAALKLKDRAHRKARDSGLDKWKAEFRIHRSTCKRLYKKDYSSYLESVEISATRDPSKFWQFIRSHSNKADYRIRLVDSSGFEVTDVANSFARHFGSTFAPPRDNETSRFIDSVRGASSVLLDEKLVFENLKHMKPSLSSGPDGIPAAILKAFKDILVPILTSIFNNCLTTNTFPATWKISRIYPIFKSGNSTDPTNYRPISILCAASKLFESALHTVLSSCVKNALLLDQHGFIIGRSTTTNLTCFMTHASKAVTDRGQIDAVYCDLSKAFDLVTHPLLLKKLLLCGVNAPLVALLGSYLLNRRCYVSVNGQKSVDYIPTSGVPQGSVLGPLLFSLFINDVSTSIKSSFFLLYADDIKVFKIINCPEDCLALQHDISSFARWCAEQGLIINASKTKVITYSRKTHPFQFSYSLNNARLSKVSEVRDLGVLFDSSLSFTPHIRQVVGRALRSLGAVCRFTRDFTSPVPFLKLYSSVCLPQLEYSSVVWNGTCQCNHQYIERVQKKFLSIYKHRLGRSSVSSSSQHQLPRLIPLSCRRDRADLLFLHKLLHGVISCPELLSQLMLRVPQKCTRSRYPFHTDATGSRHSPIHRLQSLYNSLGDKLDVFNGSLCQFRAGLSSAVCS